MIIDPELGNGLPELSDIRIVSEGENTRRDMVPGAYSGWPVKSRVLMVPGIASRPGQAVNEDDTNATKKISHGGHH